MAHHAYVITGTEEQVMEKARSFAARALSLSDVSNPDIQTFSHGLLSVDDVRKISNSIYRTAMSDQKAVIIFASRIFHEAQNALLKVCEEPPEGVTIIIGVPSLGQLLPTLRSRLLPLPDDSNPVSPETTDTEKGSADEFLSLSSADREKYITKLLDRTKSDKEEIKQGERAEASELIKGITEAAHASYLHEGNAGKRTELLAFLEDLSAFMPLMYERSAPLKLIFEHILLVIPKTVVKA
ncbi:MAG: holB [Parcubacteria group bacterium]|nr:holB [Parcubacteria group bacterium]